MDRGEPVFENGTGGALSVLVSCDDMPQPADATLRALGKVMLLLNAFLFPD